MNPLVSVIIPVFNDAHFLPEAIESVINQTYINWECIVVNDGSKDNVDEVVKPYLQKDKRFYYVSKRNEGLSSARNFGIKHTKGYYILPLDADDKLEKTFINKAISILNKKPELKIVNCIAEAFGAFDGIIERKPYEYKNLLLSNMIFSCALYRKTDYDMIGGYDESILYEDWDFWLRLLKNGGEVYKIPEPLFFYRQHKKGSLMNNLSKKNDKHQHSLNAIFSKNTDDFMAFYGNPIEIELERQKLQRLLDKPLINWMVRNRHTLFYKLISKFIRR